MNLKKIATLLFLAGALVWGGAYAWGADYTVGPNGNYPTLEDLNSAGITWQHGDTVTILPGTYSPSGNPFTLNFGSKNVTVKGSNGDVTITSLIQLGHNDFDPNGTGGNARLPGIVVGGKTGTAQIVQIKGKMVKSDDLQYEIRDHAWFAAIAPVNDPEIVVVALVQHGGSGGRTAAPVVRAVLQEFFRIEAASASAPPKLPEASAPPSILPAEGSN